MSDHADGTQFTVLGSVDRLDRAAVIDRYAYPGERWVRANMIASTDGGATSDGTSGGLGGEGDKALFSVLRELADVVLVGAATVRAEDYSGAAPTAEQRAAREARGQAAVPPIALLTRSGSVDPDAAVFQRTEVPPIVFTSAAAAPETRRTLGDLAEVVDVSGTDPESLDLGRAVDVLAERGLGRILAEGGPGILGRLIADGLLDELCLTVAPVLVGGAAGRIVTGDADDRTRLHLQQVLRDDDGYLFLRYTRVTENP
ncbi:pyrimidine reductase family protein [Mycolicibacterium sp. 018/SC-01/001]|uniref:pyrimidine reductase family protein n=1 Tax=Mycolicibacterium sp. 018/SC-01/001 TaxID=2592069 RepID=UPI00117C178A|nr:pyrimidine reductase family protein [Mycolicibacterium sp. 018/SC-01/001]TRW84828.1 pyrimidine reductase family protein [Mycolicibacterium sp. 018/SC-01/001]